MPVRRHIFGDGIEAVGDRTALLVRPIGREDVVGLAAEKQRESVERELQKRYLAPGVPTVFLLDAEGVPYGIITGYEAGFGVPDWDFTAAIAATVCCFSASFRGR